MSRNGNGTYSLPAGNPVVTGTAISSATHNTTMSDLATAITQSLAYDGQTVPVANLPMNGFRHTGVGNAAARTDYASAGQVQDGALTALSTIAGTDTITAVAPVGMVAYATGQLFSFVSAGANTGAATININGIGAKAITKNGAISLAAGDLAVNRVHLIRYDGTQFQLLNQRSRSRGADIASAGTLNLDAATGDLIDVTGTTAVTAVTLSDGEERTVRFTGILTLTNSATLDLPGGANIVTAAGDFAVFRGYSSGVVRCQSYTRKNGRSLNAVVVDRVYAEFSSFAVAAGLIPDDDTVPTSTEGSLILGPVSITPKSTTNRLRARVQVTGTRNATTGALTLALFEGTTCRAVARGPTGETAYAAFCFLEREWVPGVTTSLSITVRLGTRGENFGLNGSATARLFGGASAATLVIEEIEP